MISDRWKAWIALIGSILTLIISSNLVPVPYNTWFSWAAALITGFLTWRVPNAGYEKSTPSDSYPSHRGNTD